MVGEIIAPDGYANEIRIGRAGDVGGDYTGVIDVAESQLIEIGGSLSPASVVKIDQIYNTNIIFNNSDIGGEWLGNVEYGSTLLGGPQYVQAQSALNGSAFGQVPFLIHGVDSSLAFDGSALIS